MANSILNGVGNGVQTQWPISFPLGILSRDFITFEVDGEVDGLGDPVPRPITWINDGLIEIIPAVGDGIGFKVLRTMDKDTLIHDYNDGAPITELNLDESFEQVMMSVHEVLDGRFTEGFSNELSMNNNKLVDLADGTDPTDAVNLSQLEDMTGNAPLYASQAAASAAAALVSENNAETAETNAETAQALAEAAQAAAEAAANGMKWRGSVRFATIVNDTLSGLAVRNGVTPIAGDRVLVPSQTTTSQNGVYIAAAGAWTRATDADTWNELIGQVVVTEEASTVSGQADVPYICTINAGGTLGSTAVTWVVLPSALIDGGVSTAAKIVDGIITYIKMAASAIASAADIRAGTASKLVDAAGLASVMTPWVYGASTATTSGNSFTISGLPAGVTDLECFWIGGSTTGTNVPFFQLRNNTPATETTGYAGTIFRDGGSFDMAIAGSSFPIASIVAAAATFQAQIKFSLVDAATNRWMFHSTNADTNPGGPFVHVASGSKALSSRLSGFVFGVSDTFDAGTLYYRYKVA